MSCAAVRDLSLNKGLTQTVWHITLVLFRNKALVLNVILSLFYSWNTVRFCLVPSNVTLRRGLKHPGCPTLANPLSSRKPFHTTAKTFPAPRVQVGESAGEKLCLCLLHLSLTDIWVSGTISVLLGPRPAVLRTRSWWGLEGPSGVPGIAPGLATPAPVGEPKNHPVWVVSVIHCV